MAMAGVAISSGCAASRCISLGVANGSSTFARCDNGAQLASSGSFFFLPSGTLSKSRSRWTASRPPTNVATSSRCPTGVMTIVGAALTGKPGMEGDKDGGNPSLVALRTLLCGACAALTILASPALVEAAQQSQVRLPPLSTDPTRCEKAFVGNTIGQANGVADKLLDIRACDFTNEKNNLKGKSLSAALMSDAKFDGADMSEVIMSKAYAVNASFKGTDFTSAVIDRALFQGADLRDAIFRNALLSGSTFDNANLEGAVFEDVLIGYVDAQKLCRNTTLSDDARLILQCKNSPTDVANSK